MFTKLESCNGRLMRDLSLPSAACVLVDPPASNAKAARVTSDILKLVFILKCVSTGCEFIPSVITDKH